MDKAASRIRLRFQGEIVAKTVKKGIKKGAEAPFLML